MIFSLQRCGPSSEEVKYSQLKLIDSLYVRNLKTLRIEMDSLCEVKYPQYLARAVDSIEAEIWEEIRQLRDEK